MQTFVVNGVAITCGAGEVGGRGNGQVIVQCDNGFSLTLSSMDGIGNGIWQYVNPVAQVDTGPVANDVRKLCPNQAAHTTSLNDAEFRNIAANMIMNQTVGLGRLGANGKIFTVRFADLGSENYLFVAAASSHTLLANTLVTRDGVSRAQC